MERDSKLNVWIRGNDDNPQGVIKALEELGGKDIWGEGSDSKCMYFINDVGNIDSYYIDRVVAHCIMNTFKELKPKAMFNDKQLVWAWEDNNDAGRNLRFYDAKNNCVFGLYGQRNGFKYGNYEPYEGEYPDWAKETLKLLQD